MELYGVKGFSVYSLGAGCKLEIEVNDGKQYAFALGRASVEALITNLQNPTQDPRENILVQPSGILGGR